MQEGALSAAAPVGVGGQGKQPWAEGEGSHDDARDGVATEASAPVVGAQEPGSPAETPSPRQGAELLSCIDLGRDKLPERSRGQSCQPRGGSLGSFSSSCQELPQQRASTDFRGPCQGDKSCGREKCSQNNTLALPNLMFCLS